jgi:PII-like signaling protein
VEGRRVRVYVGEADHWQGRALVPALLSLRLREGAAGGRR